MRSQALVGQCRNRNIVKANLGKCCRVTIAAQGVLINLVNELGNRVRAIADYIWWVSTCGSDEFVTNHEHPEVVTRNVLFDNDVPANVARNRKGFCQLFACLDVDCNTFALITIAGLNDNR